MTLRGLARAAAVTVVTAAGAALPCVPGATAPAVAAADGCADGHGVTVVVDFHQLDHHDVRSCVPDGGGRDAAQLLDEAGLTLTDVQRQPGFLCRVDGLPADDPCVNTPPAGAYWSLWWSDGSSDRWSYSTVMASSLEVPDGGLVGLVWDQEPGDLRPAVAPGSAPAAATPSARSADVARPAEQDQGLPVWVGPAVLGALVVAAAGVALGRRRGSAS